MIKFYLISVMIYFTIYIVSGILMKKQFIKARNKLRKETNDNSKIYGYIRTTINYLLISFIPFVRLITLILKYYLVANTDDFIKIMKEKDTLRIL